MKRSDIERRIALFSRRTARLINELRREGQIEGARRLEAIAIEIVDKMRASNVGTRK